MSVSNILVLFQGLNVETQVERKITMSKTSFSYSISGFYSDSKQVKREAIAKISVNPNSLDALVSVTTKLYCQHLLTTSQSNFLNSFPIYLYCFDYANYCIVKLKGVQFQQIAEISTLFATAIIYFGLI